MFFSIQTIYETLKDIPQIEVSMSRLSQASAAHSQYAAAMENLKHLLNISDTIEKTHEFIIDGKLLHAHKKWEEILNVLLENRLFLA